MRNLTWRVSPLGARMLLILGTPPERAWQLNRTQIIHSLRALGEGDVAAAYGKFYLSAWAYFLSGYVDSAAGRDAISAGVEVMSRGVAVAEKSGIST
ncbi:hypothetical protein AMK68_00455 [candidate division KD3-62 bacterium DG_56]|uniref:Uncharacterized protein n=1 Tax=candidate division KD3-62 bacterium DG_56 TaxID=1704032 RepID=A0A0S7XSF7_9BACT|nr:MAG: hypothetical protein AMK68_00455 [candidate division KD3-62 bacterium DG_56]